MKVFITSLLLVIGLNQIMARSVPWQPHYIHSYDSWLDDDYGYHRIPPKINHDNFYKSMMDESKEESKELKQSQEDSHEIEQLGDFLDTLMGTFLDASEEDIKSDEKPKINTSDKSNIYGNEKDEVDVILDILFGIDEQKTINNVEDNKSSEEEEEEQKARETNNSNENSNEKTTPNLQVDIFDLTKSSEEKPNVEDNNLKSSEEEPINNKDKSDETSKEEVEISDLRKSDSKQNTDIINELKNHDLEDIIISFIANNMYSDLDDITNIVEMNDNMRAKEADEILIALDVNLSGRSRNTKTNSNEQDDSNEKEDEQSSDKKESNEQNDSNEKEEEQSSDKKESNEQNDSNEKEHEQSFITETDKRESNEQDVSNEIITTTPENDSNENNDDKHDSNSNENDYEMFSIVLQDNEEQFEHNKINDHKYTIIEPTQQLHKPTSAPLLAETIATSSTNDQNSIHEYVEIRENLDTQQNSLKKQEMDLDKDFYNIISNNYDDESMHKFETDIYVVHENLDRIKRNINAMQTLQSKLYFHKLVTAAVKDVENKSKN